VSQKKNEETQRWCGSKRIERNINYDSTVGSKIGWLKNIKVMWVHHMLEKY